MTNDGVDQTSGHPDRRTVLRRGMVVGGGMVWATPAVQTLAAPAFAAGTPKCLPTIVANYSKPAQPQSDQPQSGQQQSGQQQSAEQQSPPAGKETSGCVTYTFSATEACCDCIDRLPHLPRPLAILACKFLLKCRLESVTTC